MPLRLSSFVLGIIILYSNTCLARIYKHNFDSCCRMQMDLPKKWRKVDMKPSNGKGVSGLATFVKLRRKEKCYESSAIRLWTFKDEKYFSNFVPDTVKKDSIIQIISIKPDLVVFVRPCYHTYEQKSLRMVHNFIYKYKDRYFVIECMSHMQYLETNYPSFMKLAASVQFEQDCNK